ncbi:GNAT family N-acetyltransferase [Flavobacterium soli]|uniref:GNAT family N-acetyltransferase n=1 Tax=Flavobacterium soli TaxID=344881 RepID=UPI00042541C5|nr:GNAT family N-acetyltransferase [Flavobacterium soli]
MIVIEKFNPTTKIESHLQEEILDFLFHNLEEYGDPKNDIEEAIKYALSDEPNKGGFVIAAKMDSEIVGAVVVNETGMKKYIPENILVYIATDCNQRGKGIGKQLMIEAMETAMGSIALHVEPDNPAKKLYEKLGFTNKYLEMRYSKN